MSTSKVFDLITSGKSPSVTKGVKMVTKGSFLLPKFQHFDNKLNSVVERCQFVSKKKMVTNNVTSC